MDTLTRDKIGLQHQGVYLKHIFLVISCYNMILIRAGPTRATARRGRINLTDLRVNCYNFSAAATNHQDSFQPFCQHLQELHVWISRINRVERKAKIKDMNENLQVFVVIGLWSVTNIWWIFYNLMEMLWKVCKLESLQVSKHSDNLLLWHLIKHDHMNTKYYILWIQMRSMTLCTYMSSLYRPQPLLGAQAGWGSQASHRETLPQSPKICQFFNLIVDLVIFKF